MTTSLPDRFYAGFYKHREPDTAVAALEVFFDHPPRDVRNVARMFVRAVQIDARLRTAFEGLADRRPDLAERVRGIISAAANPSFPDPATATLAISGDLDFQWAEFLLTGSTDPVERIAAVVCWPDHTRSALTERSRKTPRLPWSRRAHAEAEARLQAHGIVLSANLDLDLLVWKRMSEGTDVREALPFRTDDAFIGHLMMKGSACWSMQSNAPGHAPVRTIYDRLDAARLPRFV